MQLYFIFKIGRVSELNIKIYLLIYYFIFIIIIPTPHITTRQARVLAHLEGLMTFSPSLAAAEGGQFDDVDEEEEEGAAAAAAEGEGEEAGAGGEGGEGGGGMNGHNGTAQ